MKTFKSVSLFICIIIPIIILGYQNCSDLSSQEINNNLDKFTQHEPIAFDSLPSMGYLQGERKGERNCVPSNFQSHMLFNATAHICVSVQNNCESLFLTNKGFSNQNIATCNSATPVNSPSLINSFTTATAADFGYVANPSHLCTMQYQRLVNVKHRKCVDGVNGCAISYLKSQRGFISDIYNFCQ